MPRVLQASQRRAAGVTRKREGRRVEPYGFGPSCCGFPLKQELKSQINRACRDGAQTTPEQVAAWYAQGMGL